MCVCVYVCQVLYPLPNRCVVCEGQRDRGGGGARAGKRETEMCETCVREQRVPEKMRLEILIERRIEILDGQSSGLFSNEPCERRPAMTIEDFDFHFDDHF